jgi:soluble P-type ATPase
MIEVDIPGFKALRIEQIICDYNGTLAVDGRLIDGVSDAINRLSASISVHVITADTFGIAQQELDGTSCQLTISPKTNQADWKLNYLNDLGAEQSICIGNGRNDRFMLKAAAVGIVLLQKEGMAVQTLSNADIVSMSILDALAYCEHPKRLIATLRS